MAKGRAHTSQTAHFEPNLNTAPSRSGRSSCSAAFISAIVLAYAAGLSSQGFLLAGRGIPRSDKADPWEWTTHPTMGHDGFNWTQLSMSRASNFPNGGIKYFDADAVRERGQMWVWHTTFARSIPAVVSGLAQDYALKFEGWTRNDYRRAWGDLEVIASFSPDALFQRGRLFSNEEGRRHLGLHRQRMKFSEYLEVLERAESSDPVVEHVSISQSQSRDLSIFGLPNMPPLLEDLVRTTMDVRNLWISTPPKTSVLHFDWQDSVLLQISGRKRFTVIDPARMHTAYPCVVKMETLIRDAPGVFRRVDGAREIDNFPLVNITHPDFDRHPLFKDAHVMTIDVPAGSALLLPAYWYHQVESYTDGPDEMNVAVNFWFQGHSLATRLYRTLRENVFINCSIPAREGEVHLCRDSVLPPRSES